MAASYQFRVGQITCTALLDGVTVIGAAGVLKRFHDATEAEYRQAFADMGLSLDEAVSSFNLLVAVVGEETILVDSGEGGRPKGGHLPDEMRQAGIAPETVTRVLITHSDGDHIFGLLAPTGEPVFPNATYVISRPELAYWEQNIAHDKADQRPIVEMMRAKGLRVIEMDEMVLPGVTAFPLSGHTPGHTGYRFESEGEILFNLADQLHSPMQFAHPEWSPTYDVDPQAAAVMRHAALGRAADEDALVMLYHLPFPGLGRVRRAGAGFRWEPVGR